MSNQTSQNNNRPVGLAASWSPVTKEWKAANHGVPIHPELGKRMFGGQMAQDEIKMPLFTRFPFMVNLPGGLWLRDTHPAQHNTLRDGQPSADKSKRHPLAQAWRDAQIVAPVDDELSISNGQLQPVLLLTAGEIPLLLSAGEPVLFNEANALASIAFAGDAGGYEDAVFIRTFGAEMLVDLLTKGAIWVKGDKLFIKTEGQPTEPAAAAVETPPTKPVRKSPVAPIFADLPGNQLDPLAEAARMKQLKKNTTFAFTLARAICNDGNEVNQWLKVNFGITPYGLVNDELVKAVQAAVAEEQLKYAQANTLAELNAYGLAVHSAMIWNGSMSSGATKYSQGRTRFVNRLYQAQAEAWLAELKKKATPQQLIDAGRRMDAERQKAMRFASSGRQH